MLSSREIIIVLSRTIVVLSYILCVCSPAHSIAGLGLPRSASTRRDLDRGTWHRGLRNTSERAARSRLNDSVAIAAPSGALQLQGLAAGASTADQMNDGLRLKKSGFASVSSTIPLGGDQYVERKGLRDDEDQEKYAGRFGNTVEYLERGVNDLRMTSERWKGTTTTNYEDNNRMEDLNLRALLPRSDHKGRAVRKKVRRETTDMDFRCVREDEADKLRDLWTTTSQRSSAALEYIEMGWDNARRGGGTCPSNCTMHLNYEVMTADALRATFRQQTTRVWQTTNTLANVFQLRDDDEGGGGSRSIVKKKVIVNLLKGLVNSDVLVSAATVAILKDDSPDEDGPQHPVILAVYRTAAVDELRVENLTRREGSGDGGDHWFRDVTAQVRSSKPDKDSTFCNLQSQGVVPFETMILDQTSLASSGTFGVWGLPVFDCAASRTWTLHYAVPLFGCGPQEELALRGALKVDLDLSAVDINQCNSNGPFAGTHRCPDHSQCVPIPGKGFHRGSYQCQCQSNLFPSNSSLFFGSFLETGHVRKTDDRGEYGGGDLAATTSGVGFVCLPCKSDCEVCRDTTPCLVEYDIVIRSIPMGIESLSITIGIALTVAIIRLRKTKVMKASFWCLLEIVTVGSLLLHATVIIQYFEPTELSCLFIPWLREVGFAIVYGALVLKVYRVLAEFQSRKAHRVQVRDKDLFKYLCCIVVVVIGYMAAWTAVTIDQGNGRTTLLQQSYTTQHLKYTMCQSTWWDYVVEVGEFLFMAFSIYICYRARSAPSNYGEVRLITLAIYNETLVSAAFYITRHFLLFAIHPDYLFLMYFIRCQLTVSITMILILGPKVYYTIWYSNQPPDENTSRSRAFSSSDAQDNLASPAEVVKLNTTLNPNGDVEIGEINLADMNPEDIRAELKRLYTQLQIYKTKTMRQDNPHISKRRGGRKQTHRRFSLQPFHSKHRHHQCSEHGEHGSTGGGVPGGETEISRTPEESTNSAEGVSIYMDESSVAETTARVPTVTFKSGNKAK